MAYLALNRRAKVVSGMTWPGIDRTMEMAFMAPRGLSFILTDVCYPVDPMWRFSTHGLAWSQDSGLARFQALQRRCPMMSPELVWVASWVGVIVLLGVLLLISILEQIMMAIRRRR